MTVINWERIGKVAGKGFLFFLEYCIKLSAFVVTGVVLATNGSFGTKLGMGFTSISPTLRGFFEKAGEVSGIAAMIHDFNVMSTNAFNAKHGVNAVNDVFAYLDGGIVYFQTVMGNLANQPFSTFFAAFLSFGSLYMISLVLRFARQKGQGSYFNRLERKLSERIYAGSNKLTKPVSETKPATSPSLSTGSSSGSRSRSGSRSAPVINTAGTFTNGNGNGKSSSGPAQQKRTTRKNTQSPNSFKKAQKTNKHIENYINSVKNG
ncbi:MAG TPA: hypothetical protein VJ905_04220 [Halalkalibaculum sp.]|nr:hypothetical protein [Halalkalibaculum sp.]